MTRVNETWFFSECSPATATTFTAYATSAAISTTGTRTYQGDVSDAIAWKITPATRIETATCDRLKRAIEGETSRFTSRGSADPTSAMSAATGGSKMIATLR